MILVILDWFVKT